MEIFNTLNNLPETAKGAVIAIGNFDGIHHGHQALLNQAKNIAAEQNKPLGILTFEPHPRNLFRPDEAPFRITPAPLKNKLLEEQKIDYLYTLPFDWDFASQSPADFIENVLKNGIAPSHIIIGYDFCFGQLRKGTPDTLKSAGYNVTIIDKVTNETQEIYSSSQIRNFIRHGDIETANQMLGWDWEIQGTIFRGDRRGRELGYPTANVKLDDTIHPAYGIYATLVNIEGRDDWLPAATNIGIRPMFKVPTGQVEAHILNFDEDIYDKILRIKPVKKLRGEARFENIDDLIKQMKIDCDQTKSLFKA